MKLLDQRNQQVSNKDFEAFSQSESEEESDSDAQEGELDDKEVAQKEQE